MSFIGLPGLQVIATSDEIEASLFASYAELKKLRHRELFEGQLKPN
jgi:hypothetical protein